MNDFTSRVARVAADHGIYIHRNSFPLIVKLTRELLGEGDADTFDSGQLTAALKGVRSTNPDHFFSAPAAVSNLTPMQKLELANERAHVAATKEQRSPVPSKLELTDKERDAVSKMSPSQKCAFFDERNAEAAKKAD